MTFHDIYRSEWQGTWALWVVPLAFLGWLRLSATARERAGSAAPDVRFVHLYSAVFALDGLADSFATGPLSRWLGISGTAAGTATMVFFVLVGDFRVLLLLFRLGRPERTVTSVSRSAALWTLLVPLTALWMDFGLRAIFGELPGQTIWVLYELAFFGLAMFLRNGWIPAYAASNPPARIAYLRAIMSYVALYYALWATADVLILIFGRDEGWGLRILPNQLYYAFWVPFAYFLFFSRRYASPIASTQTSR